MITASGIRVGDIETRMAESDERATLEGQVKELRLRIDDLEEWLTAVAEDMLDRTQPAEVA